MTPQQLTREVENLFTLPEIYFQVKKVINHPASTIDDVARVVSQDPNISAQILKIANSAFFGFATQIDTISRAISIMGLAHLHNLVLAVSTTKSFNGINNELINLKSFWLHSIYVAAIAQLLARQSNILDSERLFVCGILHDIGHLVIYVTLPTHAASVLSRAKKEQIPLSTLETETFGFDYSDVGCELLKQWNLPADLYLPIQNHIHLSEEIDFLKESAIIHIAEILVLREESDKSHIVAPALNPIALQYLDIEESQLAAIQIEARKNMAEIIKLLFSR